MKKKRMRLVVTALLTLGLSIGNSTGSFANAPERDGSESGIEQDIVSQESGDDSAPATLIYAPGEDEPLRNDPNINSGQWVQVNGKWKLMDRC